MRKYWKLPAYRRLSKEKRVPESLHLNKTNDPEEYCIPRGRIKFHLISSYSQSCFRSPRTPSSFHYDAGVLTDRLSTYRQCIPLPARLVPG